MIFIATTSSDATTDLLVPHLEKEAPVFRFDVDRADSYVWDVCSAGWRIGRDDGAAVTDRTLTAYLSRKPVFDRIDVPAAGCLEDWRRKEISDLLADLWHAAEADGRAALVRPRIAAWHKPRQMRLAARFFPVPEWHLFHGRRPALDPTKRWVVKSLAQTPIGAGKIFLVKEADPAALDPAFPWFVQEKIDAETEVSVAFVEGRIFASELRRDVLSSVDCRMETFMRGLRWSPVELSDAERSAIRAFMIAADLPFGRFDFLRKGGVLWFLEVNPDGQWAWLDTENERGLVSAVAEAVLSVHRRNEARRP